MSTYSPEAKQHIQDLNARYKRQADLADKLFTAVQNFLEVAPTLGTQEYRRLRRVLVQVSETYEEG